MFHFKLSRLVQITIVWISSSLFFFITTPTFYVTFTVVLGCTMFRCLFCVEVGVYWRGLSAAAGTGAVTSRGNLTFSNANVFGFLPSILDLLPTDKVFPFKIPTFSFSLSPNTSLLPSKSNKLDSTCKSSKDYISETSTQNSICDKTFMRSCCSLTVINFLIFLDSVVCCIVVLYEATSLASISSVKWSLLDWFCSTNLHL